MGDNRIVSHEHREPNPFDLPPEQARDQLGLRPGPTYCGKSYTSQEAPHVRPRSAGARWLRYALAAAILIAVVVPLTYGIVSVVMTAR